MTVKMIEIRCLSPDGPAILGELIASCPVTGMDMHYDSPRIDVELPTDFALPAAPMPVTLYADGKYFGRLLLGPDGFKQDPDAPHPSPYFKIEIPDILRH